MPDSVQDFFKPFDGRSLTMMYEQAKAAGGAEGIQDPSNMLGVFKLPLYAALDDLMRSEDASGVEKPPALDVAGAVDTAAGAVEEFTENLEAAKDVVGHVTDVIAATGKGADFLEKVGSLVTPLATCVTSVMESAPWLGPAVKLCAKLVEGVQAVHAAKGSCLELAEIASTVASTLDKHKSKIKQGAKTSQQVQALEGALEEAIELVEKFGKRSFLVKLYFCRRTTEEFEGVTANILRQVDLMEFDIVVDTGADVQDVKQMVAALQAQISSGKVFRNDENEALRRKIEDLGGMSAVLSSDDALGDVIASMGAQGQVVAGLTREVAASMQQLMEFHRKGTHSIIRNDELRVFWSEEIKESEVDAMLFVRKLESWLRETSFEPALADRLASNAKDFAVELNIGEAASTTVNPNVVDGVFLADKTLPERVGEILGGGVRFCTVPELPDPLYPRQDDVDRIVAALDDWPVAVVHGAPGSGRRVLAQTVARKLAKDHPAGVFYVDLEDAWRSEEDIVSDLGIKLGRDWCTSRDVADFAETATRVHRGAMLLVVAGVTCATWAKARQGDHRGVRPFLVGLLQKFKAESMQGLGQRDGLTVVVTSEGELDVAAVDDDIRRAVQQIRVKPVDERALKMLRTQTRRRGRSADDALPAHLREALVGLAVFPSTFDAEAATSVSGKLDATALLRELKDAGYARYLKEGGRWEIVEDGRALAKQLRGKGDADESVAASAEKRFVEHMTRVVIKLEGSTKSDEQLQARVVASRENKNIDRALELCDDDSVLVRRVAAIEDHFGRYGRAAELAERALKGLQRKHGEDNQQVVQAMKNLAVFRGRQGKHGEVASLFERALAIQERLFGPDDAKLVPTLRRLGGVKETLGKYDEALRVFERAAAIAETSDESRTLLPPVLGLIAEFRSREGRHGDAIALYERCLAMREETDGPESLIVASTLRNLGRMKQFAGNWSEALELHSRALAIKEKVLGPDHTDVAASLYSMADIPKLQGKREDAIAMLQRCLRIEEAALGSEHPRVAKTLMFMGDIMSLMEGPKRRNEAMKAYKRALEIRESVHGADHTHVADLLVNMAKLRAERENPSEKALRKCVELCERALRIREQALGPDHNSLASVLETLGGVKDKLGEHLEAKRLYERALEIERAVGPEREEVGDLLFGLGGLMLSMRKKPQLTNMNTEQAIAEAKDYFVQSVEIYDKHESNLRIVSKIPRKLGLIALCSSQLGKLDEAAKALERAIRIREKLQDSGEENIDIEHLVELLIDLGKVRKQQGSLQEAVRQYERALRIAEESLGPEKADEVRKKLEELQAEASDDEPDAPALPATRKIDARQQPEDSSDDEPESSAHAARPRVPRRRVNRRRARQEASDDEGESQHTYTPRATLCRVITPR
ncbi:unnamed protein product [Pedinophyceae sp. YPF-701]|nr:unnamed protein product [Pedinophyceae sp. YPF-701]